MKWEDIAKPIMVFSRKQPVFASIPIASGDTFERYVPVFRDSNKHVLFDRRLRVLEVRKGYNSDIVHIWLLGGLEPVLKRVDDDLNLSVRKTRTVSI